MSDRMGLLRHWIVRVRVGNAIGEREHIVRDKGEAEVHRAAGHQVRGPFVPEADLRGAVAAVAEAREVWQAFTEDRAEEADVDVAFDALERALTNPGGQYATDSQGEK